jgi:hypothetical protein
VPSEVRGADVGNIRVASFSTVEIAEEVAGAFAQAAAQPDPRNPRVFIRRDLRPPTTRNKAGPAPRAFSPSRERFVAAK